MISTKIRNTIIALTASLSFAGAAVAPSVSQAQWHTLCFSGHCTTHQNFKLEGKELCETINTNYNNAYGGLLEAIGPRQVLA